MVSLIQAIVLSIVQSVTEWLPISSSGHLALAEHFFGIHDFSFMIYLHFASILAVIYVFWADIVKLADLRDKANIKYLSYLLLGMIPVGIIGLLFRDYVDMIFTDIRALGVLFIASGFIVLSSKLAKVTKEKLSYREALFVGFMQMFAVLPGISRSGTTISSGLLSGIKREDAVKFSFLMAVPLILGASILELDNLAASSIDFKILAVSFIITFLTSVAAIKVLLKIVREKHFYLFGIYNILVGILILLFL